LGGVGHVSRESNDEHDGVAGGRVRARRFEFVEASGGWMVLVDPPELLSRKAAVGLGSEISIGLEF
jgi:hypothetical protein